MDTLTTNKDDIEKRIAEMDGFIEKADVVAEQIFPLIKEHFLAYAKEHLNPHFNPPYQPTEQNVTVSTTSDNYFIVTVNLARAEGANRPQPIQDLQRKLEDYEKVKPEYRIRTEVSTDLPGHAFRDSSPGYD